MTVRESRPALAANTTIIKWLTYAMFMMFAMTTDSVGLIIPQVVKEFGLTLTQAAAFHYATMTAIAVAGVSLGFLADRGRKRTILLGLAIFAASSLLFLVGNSFGFFLMLLLFSGVAIGLFKTGALALVGDISRSNTEHTATMNAVEGFFGIGAIIGPAIVTSLLRGGVSWKWLYPLAAALCFLLMAVAAAVKYPPLAHAAGPVADLPGTMGMFKNPYVLGFSLALFLYVATECAVYVWMPTLLSEYQGPAQFLVAYALSAFFVLRAVGRFAGAWMLARCNWTAVMALASFAIGACFVASLAGGVRVAAWALPLSGLFMSVIYPTLNSKGISCFAKSQHGTVAGINLFSSCAAAALGPLAMAAASDAYGHVRYGFVLAAAFACLLHLGLLANWIYNPAAGRLASLDDR